MRTTRLLLPILATAASTVLALTACDDGSGDRLTGSDDGGRLTIQLTDAPGDLQEAFIKIDRFILIRSEEDANGLDRIELTPNNAGFIELLALAGGKVLNVVNQAVVPTGTYIEVRVVLDEAYVRLKDGRVFATGDATLPAGVNSAGELKCPSC
ncbi:MAG: DUF4382 domain-containing protein, partial [Longimicrobiales bacterium]